MGVQSVGIAGMGWLDSVFLIKNSCNYNRRARPAFLLVVVLSSTKPKFKPKPPRKRTPELDDVTSSERWKTWITPISQNKPSVVPVQTKVNWNKDKDSFIPDVGAMFYEDDESSESDTGFFKNHYRY